MALCNDILDFLSRNGLECRLEKVCGHDIILTERQASILPVEITSENLDDASTASLSVTNIARLIREKTGEYPLIITEDRWKCQAQMIQFRLLAHLKIFTQIYARNCEIKKIDKSTAAEFLSANHSYGDAACRYRYGLFLKRHTGHNAGLSVISPGTLVAVATFSNARKWIKGDKTIKSYEWTRYASLPGVRLSGGMGKLLNAFIDEVNPDDIMTYADLEWSEGKVYEALGFMLEGTKSPVTFEVDRNTWTRTALSPQHQSTSDSTLYFQNLGSNKYRLKLTDYQ